MNKAELLEIGAEILRAQSEESVQAARCVNSAPVIALNRGVFWSLVQGCCNSWTCPRCGQIRARQEYGRIVQGAEMLQEAGEALYFLTLTCRGKDMPLKDAEAGYMLWTNRLLTTLRKDAKKHGIKWVYVQVTERQKRLHPHSHCITTYAPTDARNYPPGSFMPGGKRAKRGQLHSKYLVERAVSAGLGSQVDLTVIHSAAAVSRYIAKYLFADMTGTVFPPNWRRVRYSHNYPKPPATKADGFPVITSADWRRVATLETPVITRDSVVQQRAWMSHVFNVALVGDQD